MTAAVDLVYKNFVWRIENLSPTNQTVGKKFLSSNFDRVSPGQSSGTTRNFNLSWNGSASPGLVEDWSERIAQHSFTLWVAYSTDYKNQSDLFGIILQDRHDLIKELRDSDHWLGYSADYSTTNIGLFNRYFQRDSIDASNEVTWYLKQEYQCDILEGE